KVDIADVVAAAAFVGDSANNPVSAQGLKNGDVQNTGDGLTASDALAIQQYLAGAVELPVK
ncbi:MAG: lysophospholipase, partial [Ruminococcus sp.]|nr:lysophospholipase [Ruminococcus sp.]